MPAPYKKRKSFHQGDKGDRADYQKHSGSTKLKHGRQQMRNVTRTARRDYPQEDDLNQEEDEDEENSSDDDVGNKLNSKPSSSSHDKSQSYNALLTLLTADHKDDSDSTKKKRKLETQLEKLTTDNGFEESEDEEDDAVAGVNFENEDQDEEDEEELQTDDEDDEKLINNDPFEAHYNNVKESYIDKQAELLKSKQKWTIQSKQTHPELGYSSMYQVPPGDTLTAFNNNNKASQLEDFKIKKRIVDAYVNANKTSELSIHDQIISEPIFKYQDVSFPYRHYQNNSYQKLYVTHALNHIFKTRDRILKNNEKLHNYQASLKEGKAGIEDEPELRDQGFTRPKVLILLPTRNVCNDVVDLIIKLSGAEQQENKKKFQQQFYSPELPPDSKPLDFKEIFKGNNNDFFSIGLKFTRKSLKLYSSFYSSDIIIASPIGLSMILENPDKRKQQYDFLSSIEVLIIDKANSIEMQNWDHINTVLKYVNKIPKDFHDADFSRIRMWSINDQANLLRQNLIFSEYLTPNINNLISSKSSNLSGKSKFKPIINSQNCIMNSIGLKIKQIFQRFDGGLTPSQNPELRFKFFINSVLPSLIKSNSYDDGLLIYIPSYYDYLRIKEYMRSSTKFTFDGIDEYSSQSKLSRTRSLFQQGKIKILLYTERLHHFRRFEINGVKNVLVYEVPTNPVFYKELVKFIGKSIFKSEADLDLSFIKIIFSKWDGVSLERIIGNERAPVLCNSVNELYEFR